MAHDFGELQFTVEFMALGVWQSPSHGRAPGSREGASTGRYTLWNTPQVPQPSRWCHQLRTTMRSDMSPWKAFLIQATAQAIYLGCAAPSVAGRAHLPCSDGLAGLVYDCLVPSGCLSTQEQYCSCIGC